MSKKSAETSKPIFREFHSPKELHWLTSIISALGTHALSGMRTSFIGQAMKSSYYACNLESGKGDHLFRTAIHITNGTTGTRSDIRRKQIINDKLAEESLFEDLMEKFRIRFRHLAINLQRSIKAAIEKNLDTVQRTLDIVKSENVASESEQEKEFRGRVEAMIKTAEEKIRQINSGESTLSYAISEEHARLERLWGDEKGAFSSLMGRIPEDPWLENFISNRDIVGYP